MAETSSNVQIKWLQIFCYPCHFLTKFSEIRSSIPSRVMDILNSSPFAQFFNFENTVKMDRYIIQDAVQSYDIGLNTFTVGGHSFCFSSEEACAFLGLPLTGNSVNLSSRVGSCDLRSKYLSSSHRPTREQLFLGVKRAIESFDVDNAARLLLLFLFSTFLFPAANSSTPPALFEYVSDLSGLWAFKWGDEVFQYLMSSVRHAVKARQSGKRSVTLHGCSLLLLVSFSFL